MTRVLFVDNDAASLVLYEEIAQMMGIECVCIQKSTHLATELEKLPPIDVAFVDLEMPTLNGYEVLTLLRAQPQFQSIPIVVCSVYAGEIEQAYQSGFNGFIAKPISIDRFPEQVMAILNGQVVWERYSN